MRWCHDLRYTSFSNTPIHPQILVKCYLTYKKSSSTSSNINIVQPAFHNLDLELIQLNQSLNTFQSSVHLCSSLFLWPVRKVKDLKILKSLLLSSRKVWTPLPLIKSDPRHLALIEQIGQAHLEKPRRIDAEIGPRSANPMTQELHFGKGIVIFRFRSWVPTRNWL